MKAVATKGAASGFNRSCGMSAHVRSTNIQACRRLTEQCKIWGGELAKVFRRDKDRD